MFKKIGLVLVLCLPLTGGAQTVVKKPSKALVAPASANAYPAVPAGAGYRFAPLPTWIKPVPPANATPAAGSTAKARRELLVDMQVRLGDKLPATASQSFFRLHNMALDSSTQQLRECRRAARRRGVGRGICATAAGLGQRRRAGVQRRP